jgi:hypothetical protein
MVSVNFTPFRESPLIEKDNRLDFGGLIEGTVFQL